MTTLKVDKVERMLMDKVCKMMRPLKEMIDVTSPNTVWVEPMWVEENPVVEQADSCQNEGYYSGRFSTEKT